MSIEFIKFFIQATESVLKSVIGEVPTRGRVEIHTTNPMKMKGVTVLIGITGGVSGQVLYGMSSHAACSLCSRMMGGREVTELDALSQSALSELANMISGNAATYLEQAGLASDITAPSLVIGEDMDFNVPGTEAVMVPFTLSTCGELSLILGLKAVPAKV